jgi:hypothetical protein
MVVAWQEGFNGVEYFSGFSVHRTAGLQREPEAILPVSSRVKSQAPMGAS